RPSWSCTPTTTCPAATAGRRSVSARRARSRATRWSWSRSRTATTSGSWSRRATPSTWCSTRSLAFSRRTAKTDFQRRKVEVIPLMRRLIAFALVLLAARSAHAAAGPLPAYREVLNLRYAPGAGNRHTLDVFTPAGYGEKKAPRPVVLFVHGGTRMAGDKNFFGMYRGVGRALASGGAVAVLANYRLSPRVRHPEHVKDVACAFAWTYRNVHRYGGDPSRIFLAGHSAGAHLVSLLITDE